MTRQPLAPGKLTMIQAHWQTSGTSDVMGELWQSSILQMTAESAVNSWVRDQPLNASAIQIIEVDDACDPAVAQIKAMLDAANAAALSPSRNIAQCKYANFDASGHLASR